MKWYHLIGDSNAAIQGADFVKGAFIAEHSLNRLTVEVSYERNPDVEADIEDFLKRIGVPHEAVALCDSRCPSPR